MAQGDSAQPRAPLVLPGENPSGRRWLVAVAAAFFLGLYALFLSNHLGTYAGGSDSSGYLNKAKLFEQGAVRTPERLIAGVDDSKLDLITFVPLGFQPVDRQTMAPGYATGVPLMLLLISRFTGWETAPAVLAILFSLLGILVTAWLGREFGLSSGWAWFAAALLAITPNYLNMSPQLMSDVPATVFCTVAIILAWKSRARPALAFAAGAVFAASVLVRPTDFVMIVPVAICLGLNWRSWMFFCLAGLPGAVFFCIHNFLAFGHPLEMGYGNETGYGKVNTMFTLKVVPLALTRYAQWFPFALTPVGLLAFGLPFLLRRDPIRVSVLLSWIFVVLGFYAIDSGANHEFTLLRYLLPAFPAIMVGGAWVLKAIMHSKPVADFFERVSGALPRLALWLIIWVPAISCCLFTLARYRHEHDFIIHYVLPALPIAVAIGLDAKVRREKNRGRALLHVTVSQLVMVMALVIISHTDQLGLWAACEGEIAYPQACAWATEHLPGNAVIYTMQASGAVFYYTSFTQVRWPVVTPVAQAEIERVCAASNRPIYAMLFPYELDEMRDTHFLDGWTKIKSVKQISIWQLDSSLKAAATP